MSDMAKHIDAKSKISGVANAFANLKSWASRVVLVADFVNKNKIKLISQCVLWSLVTGAATAADPANQEVEGGDQARAAGGKTVTLTFAAKDTIGVANWQISSIFTKINLLLSVSDYKAGQNSDGSTYPADVSCINIKFVPGGGGLQTSPSLPDVFASGVKGYDWKDFTDVVKADVYVVNSITCGDVTDAIGCAPIKGVPRVVTIGPGLDGGTVLHEYGHSVGLHHSNGDGSCPADYHQSREGEWRRVMYCRAVDAAKGFTAKECQTIGGVASQPDPSLVASSSSDQAIEPDLQIKMSDLLRSVLHQPRLEQNVLNPSVAELSYDDIKVVQSIISKGSPVDLLLGAAIVLGERGDISDAYLLKSFVLNNAVPASSLVPPAKFAAISAIGKIGGRLKSQKVLAELVSLLDRDRVGSALGPNLVESVRLHAILALGEGKDTAKPILQSLQAKGEAARSGSTIDLQTINPGTDAAVVNEIQKAEPVSPEWISRAQEISAAPKN